MNSAIFSPHGEYFASGGADGRIFVWKSNLDDTEDWVATGSSSKQTNKTKVRLYVSLVRLFIASYFRQLSADILLNEKF